MVAYTPINQTTSQHRHTTRCSKKTVPATTRPRRTASKGLSTEYSLSNASAPQARTRPHLVAPHRLQAYNNTGSPHRAGPSPQPSTGISPLRMPASASACLPSSIRPAVSPPQHTTHALHIAPTRSYRHRPNPEQLASCRSRSRRPFPLRPHSHAQLRGGSSSSSSSASAQLFFTGGFTGGGRLSAGDGCSAGAPS